MSLAVRAFRTDPIPVALALLSVAVISFQIVIMQTLSLLQGHHFAGMVISMAMLGFGAAGTLVSLVRRRLLRHFPLLMPTLCLLTSLAMIVSTRVAGGAGRFDPYLLFFESRQIVLLAASYLVLALPFFCAGLALTLAFVRDVERIGRLYFANLAGSAAGAVLVSALVGAVRLELLPPLLAAFPLAAGLVCASRLGRRARIAIAAVSVLAVAAAAVAAATGVVSATPLEPSEYKDVSAALDLPGAELVHRSDGAFGRVEVVTSPVLRASFGASLNAGAELPVRDAMFVNGDFYGTLYGRAPDDEPHPYEATTRALPYALRDRPRVLVLGAATGVGVSHALAVGAASVDAVEENLAANALLQERHPEWIDGVYRDPRVRLHGESNRGFLARAPAGSYDLVVAPELGAFGGETGLASLATRYDLTREAFARMWRLLSPSGSIAATVWVDAPPRSILRLVATWRELLAREGVEDPRAHLVALRGWATITLVVSRSPVTSARAAAVRDLGDRLGFDPLLMPGLREGERDRYNRLPDRALFEAIDELIAGDPSEVYRDYRFDVRPVPDDRPFFSRFLRLRSLPAVADAYGVAGLTYLELGTLVALVAAVQIVLAAIVFITLPLARTGWSAGGRRCTVLTFVGTGTGFMFFEIAMIEHAVLLLGNPAYATATVLAVVLASSGVGSLLSARLPATGRALLVVGAVSAAAMAVYALGLMPAVRLATGWPRLARSALLVVLLALPAVAMGMMFPLGLRRLGAARGDHVPWACAIDSALSVVATALATLVAQEGGFTLVLGVSAGAYLVAGLAGARLGTGQSQPVSRASPRT